MSELLQAIDASIASGGDQTAFRCGPHKLSWRELDQAADSRMQTLTSQGLMPGDRVACALDGSLELPIALLAHLRAGLIHVPVNTRYRDAEVDHLFNLTGPSACVGLDRAPQPSTAKNIPHDAALLLSTSGTTGAPKGVLHTHASLAAGMGALTKAWGWTPNDQQVLSLPLFHVHGLGLGLIGALMRGVSTHIMPRFDPASVCDAMAQGGTLFMGVPTMYVALVEHFDAEPEQASSFKDARLCCAGSAALSTDTLRRFEEHTSQIILERYGMSETLITVSNPLDGERRAGSIGRPIPGVETRIEGGEEGELWVRGPTLMHSYWQDAVATEEAHTQGWFRTGDRVCVDADGYLHHQGRLSVDWIKSGGWRIGAQEIESLLEGHDAVHEAAVVGLPDARWGDVVAAAVVLKTNTSATAESLAAYLHPRIADYKQVRRWQFVEQLPRNALGKIQKRRLIEGFKPTQP